jgi:hypothetical protein
MTAAALDATQTAAHTVVFSVAMFCFVVGDSEEIRLQAPFNLSE